VLDYKQADLNSNDPCKIHFQKKGGNQPLRQEDETLAHGAKHMHGHWTHTHSVTH